MGIRPQPSGKASPSHTGPRCDQLKGHLPEVEKLVLKDDVVRVLSSPEDGRAPQAKRKFNYKKLGMPGLSVSPCTVKVCARKTKRAAAKTNKTKQATRFCNRTLQVAPNGETLL